MAARQPCLVTQLVVPPLPFGMVDRPRLVERLEQGRREPVTLVCAAAGSGKTTLVASAVRTWTERVAWVSLEPSDNRPERFWNAVLVALECAGVAPAGSALAELAAPRDRSDAAFAPLLVNALAELPEPAVLVLDDLHHVRSRACFAQLSSVVTHLPDTLRMVLIGRSDPPLPLHRLRVSGRLVEIRGADLAFNDEEAVALLEAHGLDLSVESVRSLRLRTEGWSAGLRLAALSLRGREDREAFVARFAGDDRAVADYLLAEVLDQQSARMRSFLLRACLVDQVCGELADVLTGSDGGADTLAELERSNAFVVRCDAHGEWYRFHTLFARVLQARAQAELRDELPALRRRAADWYEAHDLAGDALKQAVLAEEWDLAATVVAERWFDLSMCGDAERVAALVSTVPEPWRSQDAEVAAALACTALDAGDRTAAERHLADAERAARALPEPRLGRYREALALARLAHARLDGDFDTALAAADGLLSQARACGRRAAPERRALVHAMLGETAVWARRFDRAEDHLQHAISAADTCGLDHVAIAAMGDLAYLRVLVEGPGGDHRCAHDALERARRRGWTNSGATGSAHAALAIAALDACRDADCLEHLAHMSGSLGSGRPRPLDLVLVHARARVCGARGTPAAGLDALDDWEALRGRVPLSAWERDAVRCLRARLLLLAGDRDAAVVALGPVDDGDDVVVHVTDAFLHLAAGAPARALETLGATAPRAQHDPTAAHAERTILEAIAHYQLNDVPAARLTLEQALADCAETGRFRPFLEVGGGQIEELLRDQIREATPQRAQATLVLDLVRGDGPGARPVTPVLEPLSERERVVLRYLPTALSNREIADELFVTTNTVKTHLRSIYRKLDVGHRHDAVARARELRLVGARDRAG